MISLVADIGGTNTRLALAGPEFGITALRRYENANHRGFDEILSAYCDAETLPQLSGACIAVAGPVSAHEARLTNGNWLFDAQVLGARLGAPVQLLNDLAALGHALPDLTADQRHMIRPEPPLEAEGRSLVVGLGTGFNVCQVLRLASGSTVLEAELGHASLPGRLRKELHDVLGRGANVFLSNEDLFSGSGLSQLHRVATDGSDLEGAALMAAATRDPEGEEARTVTLAGTLLGMMTRELVYQYMPLAGIYFAGSAGRGLMTSVARDSFVRAFDQEGALADTLGEVPLCVIADDAAGLTGAARVAGSIYRPTA